jgi:hypothetical protein
MSATSHQLDGGRAALKGNSMSEGRTSPSPPGPIVAAQGRQILFYAPDGLLGGTLTCSRCGGTGRQPDMIEHDRNCSYVLRPRPPG